MKQLTKGANAILTRSGTVQVNLSWKSPIIDLDVSCFAITAHGKVPSDEWFVFYNQPDSPNRAIHFSQTDANQTQFVVHLDQLPADIQKCVFAATLSQSSFREVTEATITAVPPTGEALTFKISDSADEQALIFAEIYRYGSDWKMRAIGQGFKGGLKPLAEYYGIQVTDEPRPVSAPGSRPAPPVPPASPSRDSQAQPSVPRRKRPGFLKKLVISLMIVLLIASASITGLAYYYPQLLFLISPQLSSLVQPSIRFISDDPKQFQASAPETATPIETTCPFTDEQVFDRYHTLGENYIRILKTVDIINQHLSELKEELKKIDSKCPQAFVDKNNQEVEQLEKLPIQDWIEETNRLNICAGIMIKKVDTDLQSESRPTIIQRLLRNADRSRNLESDLTNISRDLAYLKNKADRLVKEGYRSNIEACLK